MIGHQQEWLPGVYLEVWVRGAGMLTTMDIVPDHEEDGVQVLLGGREQQVDLVELGGDKYN